MDGNISHLYSTNNADYYLKWHEERDAKYDNEIFDGIIGAQKMIKLVKAEFFFSHAEK